MLKSTYKRFKGQEDLNKMVKIYSNHLFFLSYLLKCPVDNTGNGISEPINLKIFWGSMPQPPYFGAPSVFYLFPLANLQNLTRRPCYTNLENVLLKTVSGGDFSSEPLSTCNFYGSDINRERLETKLTSLKMDAHATNFHSLCVIHNRIS